MKIKRRISGTSTISGRLFLSFGSAVAITLLIAIVGFINNAILSSTVARVVESTSVRQAIASEISLDFSETLSLERGLNMRALMSDRAQAQVYNQEFLAHSSRLSALTSQLAPMLSSGSDKQLCSELIAANLELRHLHDIASIQFHNGELLDTSSPAYVAYIEQYVPKANLAAEKAKHLLDDQVALIRQDSLSAARAEIRSRYLTLFMLFLFFVVGGFVTQIVVSSNRSLRQITVGLGKEAAQIAAAAMQVSSSSQLLAKGASEQATFIEQTSTSVEEIAGMARRNTRNAQTTASIVADSQRYIIEGNRVLDQMVAAMDGIAVSSTQISKIVRVIDQIAFQTNILALNAAAEAARAGDAGNSFAVVADEVSKLAQRSAQAAKDTALLIEDCLAKSQTGKLQVDGVATAMRAITNESGKINLLVDEIYSGSREQSRGIDQVSKSILRMEQVTQTTADGAEQSAAAAGQLNTQFQTLNEITRNLAAMLGTAVREERQESQPARRGRAITGEEALLAAKLKVEAEARFSRSDGL